MTETHDPCPPSSDNEPETDPAALAQKGYQLALRRVSARESTALEIETYLEKKGIPPRETAQIVRELVEEGLINQERYLRAYIRSNASRRRGPLRLLNALKTKGIEISLSRLNQVVREELEDWDEIHTARQLVERRFPEAASDPKIYRRAYQALLRRGFSSEIAKNCLGPPPKNKGPR
jgi:regulatory protein